MTFTPNDINSINSVFEVQAQNFGDSYTWTIKNNELQDKLILTLYTNILSPKGEIENLVSVTTQVGTFEIHNCNAFMIFEPDEVFFINSNPDTLSSLIIGKKGTASFYSNIDKSLLSKDITTLDNAYLLAAMQLSLTEFIV